MGAARDHENPNAGHRHIPKLTLAGRLTATWEGRPVVIEAGESGVRLNVAGWRTAWSMRRVSRSLAPLLLALRGFEVPVTVNLAGIMTIDLLPRPSALAKIVVPGLAQLF